MADVGWASLAIIPSFRDFGRNLERGSTKQLAAAGKSGGAKFGAAAAAASSDTFASKVDLKGAASRIASSAGSIVGAKFGAAAADEGGDTFSSQVDLKDGARRAGDQAGEDAGKAFGSAAADAGGDSFSSKIGGAMKTGAAAGGAAAGLAFGVGIGGAIENGALADKLAAQIGAGAGKSRQLGKVAGDLYAGAYGDSMEGVNGAIRSVVTNLDGFRNASKGRLKDITASVLDLTAAFDEQPEAITRAASQMVRTGLAKSSKQALNIITRGFQTGADKSEDLLDTFNEYGTQFRKLGLDGKTAMGLLSQGLQGGARDADIVADSLKEFSIRSVEALEQTDSKGRAVMTDLGAAFTNVLPKTVDMYEAQNDLAAGGKRASETFTLMLDGLKGIENPADRAKTAVALFGTQAEDMGDALFALDPSKAVDTLGKVEGAAKRMGDTLADNASSRITSFKRTLGRDFQGFLARTVIPFLEDKALPALKDFGDWFGEDGLPAIKDFGRELKPVANELLPAVKDALGRVKDFLVKAAPKAKEFVGYFNDMPDWAKTVLIGGGAAAIVGKKLGLGGLLKKGAGAITGGGVQKVFVVNMGVGMGGAGKGAAAGAAGAAAAGSRAARLAKFGVAGAAIYITGKVAMNFADGKNSDLLNEVDRQQQQRRIEGGSIGDVAKAATGIKDTTGAIKELDRQYAGLTMREPGKGLTKFQALLDASDVSATDLKKALPSTAREIEKAGGKAKIAGDRTDYWKTTLREVQRVQPQVTITTPGLDKAIEKTERYKGLIESFDGASIRVKGTSGGRFLKGLASGGPVNAGQTYMVGERGPELFRSNTPGRIIPNHQVTTNNNSPIHFHGPVTFKDGRDFERRTRRLRSAPGGR